MLFRSYQEVPVKSEALKITGHSDGILVGYGDPLLLEIKSVGVGSFRYENPDLFYKHDGDFAKMWADFKNPFMSHIMQAQIYLHLVELDEKIEHKPQEIVFLYHGKPNDEIKEIVVPKSSFGITEILEAAEMIVSATSAPSCNVPEKFKTDCAKCRGYND